MNRVRSLRVLVGPERIAKCFGAESSVDTLGQNVHVAPTNDISGVAGTVDGRERSSRQ